MNYQRLREIAIEGLRLNGLVEVIVQRHGRKKMPPETVERTALQLADLELECRHAALLHANSKLGQEALLLADTFAHKAAALRGEEKR